MSDLLDWTRARHPSPPMAIGPWLADAEFVANVKVPVDAETSLNVPSPLLRKSWLGLRRLPTDSFPM